MAAAKQEVFSTVVCSEVGKATHCDITLRENGKVASCTLDLTDEPFKLALNCSGNPEIMRKYQLK